MPPNSVLTTGVHYVIPAIEKVTGVREIHRSPHMSDGDWEGLTIVAVETPTVIDEMWSALKAEAVDVRSFVVRKPSLEEVFLELTASDVVLAQPNKTPH